MGILHDEVVVLRPPEKEGDPTVITVNCPDKLGLGCDLCRILLFFGLSISRVDFATDGKWCYVVLWVLAKPKTRWSLVKKRLVGACPSFSSASGLSYFRTDLQPPKVPDVYLLKFCCQDRKGILHDVTNVLHELELNIKKVKVSTTPDGNVLDLFFITDTRGLLHTKKRQEDTKEQLRSVIGDAVICDIEKACTQLTSFSQASSFLPSAVTDKASTFETSDEHSKGASANGYPSITMDNSLSPSHTLLQIVCRDYKGLLYDLMRTIKDYNMQISYGRGTTKSNNKCEIDLFIMQSDGKKITDSSKQNSLCSRLYKELAQPFDVAVVSRGPETELLVTNPVELSGEGRPLVFHDITLALKSFNICIFSAEIGRHIIEHRECEVYRFLLNEIDCLSVPRNKIEERVQKTLMGWEC